MGWRRRTATIANGEGLEEEQQQQQQQGAVEEEDLEYIIDDENENEDDEANTWKDFSPPSPSSQRAAFSFGANDARFSRNDWRRHGMVHLLACAFMNIFCLGVYGVLQERVMTIPYESSKNDDESGTYYPDAIFTSSIFLVLSNRVCALLVGGLALFYTSSSRTNHHDQHPHDRSNKKKYWWWPDSSLENYACVAFSNLMSTLCQYEVLKYLSYAISTLAKAAKILPTMFWGFILHGRRFRTSQYLSAMVVTVGCFVFVFNSSLAAKYTSEGMATVDAEEEEEEAEIGTTIDGEGSIVNLYASDDGLYDRGGVVDDDNQGEMLLEDPMVSAIFKEENDINAAFWKKRAAVGRSSFQRAIGTFRSLARDSIFIGVCITLVYLAADGFTSSFQQRMFRVQKTSLFDQMFWTCVFGTLFSAAWVVLSGQLEYALLFLHRYPKIIPDIIYLSMASALAQVSITYTIRAFGAVTLASVMTVRQVVSISLNAFLFHEPLVLLQWVGLGFILLPVFFGGAGYKKELETTAGGNIASGGALAGSRTTKMTSVLIDGSQQQHRRSQRERLRVL
jgi:drug/metabolite transporter (DMT)-like permease